MGTEYSEQARGEPAVGCKMLQENRSPEHVSNEVSQEKINLSLLDLQISKEIQNPAVQAYGIKRNMMITNGSPHQHAKGISLKQLKKWLGWKEVFVILKEQIEGNEVEPHEFLK